MGEALDAAAATNRADDGEADAHRAHELAVRARAAVDSAHRGGTELREQAARPLHPRSPGYP